MSLLERLPSLSVEEKLRRERLLVEFGRVFWLDDGIASLRNLTPESAMRVIAIEYRDGGLDGVTDRQRALIRDDVERLRADSDEEARDD